MKKKVLIIAGIIIIGIGLFMVSRVMANNRARNVISLTAVDITPTPADKMHTDVNQSLSITLPGKNTKKLNYIIETADVTNNIIVNGQRVQSTGGKSFLILNLKVTNDNSQGVQINSRDYARLSGQNNEWYAPEIFNDPTEIQAISTKIGRIGFTVDNNQKNFKLRIGEINGDKREIAVNFP